MRGFIFGSANFAIFSSRHISTVANYIILMSNMLSVEKKRIFAKQLKMYWINKLMSFFSSNCSQKSNFPKSWNWAKFIVAYRPWKNSAKPLATVITVGKQFVTVIFFLKKTILVLPSKETFFEKNKKRLYHDVTFGQPIFHESFKMIFF